MYPELILNLTLLVALSVVSGFLHRRWAVEAWPGALLQGGLFGGAAVVGMLYPAVLGPGLIFDGRSIMLSLAAYFFGPWAALPAVLATGGLRLAIGGEGTLMGVLVIFASAGIGLVFHRWYRPQAGPVPVTRLLALGLAVHAAMLVMFLALPGDLTWVTLQRVGLPVILLYPLITLLAGKILADQQAVHQLVASLRRAHKDLDVTLQSIGDAVVSTDLAGRVVRMNPVAEQLTGWPLAAARHRPLGEVCRLIHETTRQPVPNPVETALRTGQAVSLSNHTLLVARDGTERVIADSAAPICDEAGTVNGVVLVFSDKTAEHAAQEALRLVDAALEAAANAIIITDRTGLIVWVNPAYTALTGYTAGEAIGRNPRELNQSGRHPPEFYSQLWATILAGKVWQGTVVNRRKDGGLYTEEMVITPVRNARGELTHFIAIIQDITARQQAEDKLRTSEKDLRASQRFARVGSWHLNVATNQVVWSEELYRMYGFDPARPPPPYTEHMKLFTPGSWEKLSTALANTRATGVPYELELETVKQDGRNGWMWVRGETEVDAEGSTIGLWGAAQDITARKQAENEARQSYSLLANLARLVPGVVYQYRLYPDGRSAFPYASPGMNDIYEVTPAEVREDATPVFGRIHPDDLGRVGDLIQESARTLQTFYCEFRVILPRQGLRWRWSQAQPERMEDGGTLWHGIISDVTERKEAEVAQKEALREKEALLKEVHHRVKNNLQVITSLLRLEAGRSTDPGTVSVLDDMKDRIRSMALLHETLYRSGNFAEVDMAAYLRQLTAQLFRSQVKRPGAVHLDLDLAPVRLEIDRAIPCGLIVNELASNSLKHAFADGRTGRVHIGLQPVAGGSRLQLLVSDDGAGLPAGFELGRTRSLGLQLVSDLARQLQGQLEMTSSGPGASFAVTFSTDHSATAEADRP